MADDATGALEAGAILASLHVETVVELEAGRTPPAQAQVLLIPTRHDSPAMARKRVREVLAGLAHTHDAVIPIPPRLYWKSDSTLRGPIGACFDALISAFPGRPLVYIPAYPAMGRTVAGGVLRIDGVPLAQTAFAQDSRNPARGSVVTDVIALDSRLPVAWIRSAGELRRRLEIGGEEVLVCDAGTEAEVAELIAECRGARTAPVVAGPAGGIASWAGDSGAGEVRRARVEDVDRWLVVCGSRHPAARAQMKRARELGFAVFATADAGAGDAEAELEALVRQAADEARRIARAERIGIVIFGGDTVLAVCRAMGVARLAPLGELMPGVAVSHAGGCTFVTVAGGFSAPRMLEELMAAEER